MTAIDQSLDITQADATEFSWDSLPEVAKERWEQMVAYSSTIEGQLTKAKASRAQAEIERQRIAKEILSATKEACQEVVSDAKRTLDKIKGKTEEAARKQEEADRQVEEAKIVRAEADAYVEAVKAQAREQADQILQMARSTAEAAGAKLMQQVSLEAQRLLAQAEAMRTAAREELEAQRIYAEAAMLKADAHEALDQLKAQLAVPEPLNGDGPDGFGLTWEIAKRWETVAQAGTPPVQETSPQPPTDAPTQPAEATPRASVAESQKAGETPGAAEERPGDAGETSDPHKARTKDRRDKAV